MKYPRPMHDAASRLTDKEYRFIRKEFGITKKELLHLSEDLLIEFYDELCNIEATLKEIQAWLGHSTIGTTANIYTHLDENNKLSSANAILSILPEK